MQINVSQLLKEPIGSSRNYEINEVVAVTGDDGGRKVQGEIRLLRTHRGILVQGELHTEVELACGRCLSLFQSPIMINFEEEYLPTIDIASGVPLPSSEEAGSFVIDEHHVIDLTEAIRQYTLLAIPMKPLCREDCAGICQECGHNLNQGPCGCSSEAIDPRWSKLNKLL
ncbi:MAG: DUF177 domain-containing protein [Dehalococcoidales bacterium]